MTPGLSEFHLAQLRMSVEWARQKKESTMLNGHAGADALGTPAPADFRPVSQSLTTTTNSTNPFAKAVKYNAKGRVALTGPPGSGKSFTALVMARALAGPHGKIAAIDTEHGSLSKYADLFDFDVLELDSFSPQTFVASLHAAEEAAYDVFLCDSLSHFWMGKDGALEYVDAAKKRSKDQMDAWKTFRPHERAMVEDMIASPCHVICTMRTKTEFQEQIDDKGKKKRVKIGLAPVQREGLEYEFDLVGYMDEENTFIADKTRCSAYANKAFTQPGPKDFAPFVEWLKGTARQPKPTQVAQPVYATGDNPTGTVAAAAHVAQQKIDELKTSGEIIRAFAAIREPLGEFLYLGILSEFGVNDPKHFRDRETAVKCYKKMLTARRNQEVS
jgi:energy-coupling factor transporter ATP-binding protein EcfA2